MTKLPFSLIFCRLSVSYSPPFGKPAANAVAKGREGWYNGTNIP